MAVGSAVLNSHPRNVVAWTAHVSLFARRMPETPPEQALAYGASYARSLFARYGLFRADLRIGEDTEFHARLARHEKPLWSPSVQAIHRNPTRLRSLLADQFARGRRSGREWRVLQGASALGAVAAW